MDRHDSPADHDPLALAREVAGGDVPFLHHLLQTFVMDATNRVDRMTQAVESGDMTEAMRILHSLKGSAASLGAQELARQAEKAEKALRYKEPGQAAENLREFNEEFERLIQVIHTEIST